MIADAHECVQVGHVECRAVGLPVQSLRDRHWFGARDQEALDGAVAVSLAALALHDAALHEV
jgi:hypothetical protein